MAFRIVSAKSLNAMTNVVEFWIGLFALLRGFSCLRARWFRNPLQLLWLGSLLLFFGEFISTALIAFLAVSSKALDSMAYVVDDNFLMRWLLNLNQPLPRAFKIFGIGGPSSLAADFSIRGEG